MKPESLCKWGKKTEELRNSSAWRCLYKLPLSLIAKVNQVSYNTMTINVCLCNPIQCRCYEEENTAEVKDRIINTTKTAQRREKMETPVIEYCYPFFSVNLHDSDGDVYERGIYLHYGDTIIKVADTLSGFKAHAEDLMAMVPEIGEVLNGQE